MNDALLGISFAAALGAGLLAVDEHAATTGAGYRLAVALREGEELRRMADAAGRRATRLAAPQAALARAAAGRPAKLAWPTRWNVVRAATLEACAHPADAPAPDSPPQLTADVPTIPVSARRSPR